MNSNEFTIGIPANGVANFHARGRAFACISTTAAYTVRADNGDAQSISAGRGFSLPSGEFNRLTFRNATGSEITTTFYVGQQDYVPDRSVTLLNSTITVDSSLKNDISDCIDAVPSQSVRNVAVANTAVALAAASTKFRKAILYGFKTAGRVANAGSVFIGADGTGTNQPIELFAGGEYVLEPSVGNKSDLASWFVNSPNVGDGVVIIIVS